MLAATIIVPELSRECLQQYPTCLARLCTSALELENPAPRRGGMIMQLNKVHSVKTIDRVASEMGETVDRVFDLAIDIEAEDGVIWVYGVGDASVFPPLGIENL
jgi:hypothetical protein